MDVSLVGSCIRVKEWLKIYEALSVQNDLKFELIFAGPRRPDFDLPDNFCYIYADVKPTQCWSIAARASRGYLISIFGDDITLSDHALDKAHKRFQRERNSRAVIVPEFYYHNKRTVLSSTHYLVKDDNTTPLVPQALAFYEKKFFSSFKGSDRRFVAALGDYDLYLRALKKGAYLVCDKDIWQRHSDEGPGGKKNQSYLYRKYKRVDRPLLYKLWLKDGKFVDRTSPHEPFVYDDTIYTATQGSAWNGENGS